MKGPYINGWKGLSEYLGGTAYQTLVTWEKQGLIKKYRLGKRVYFLASEIDHSMKPIERMDRK